jgi:hypothetical protein
MPDLKSELSKVLQEWDSQDTPSTPAPITIPTLSEATPMAPTQLPRTITTNVTRATFNHVKNNPGIPRAELVSQLEAMGQLRTSAAAMVSQLLRNGNIEYIGNGLFVTQEEYAPLQNDTPRPKRSVKAKVTAPETTPQSAGLPSILSVSVHDPVPAPAPAPTYATPDDWTVDAVIGSLNVRQAMAVYSELRNIFGA